jgi:hypothetical protein
MAAVAVPQIMPADAPFLANDARPLEGSTKRLPAMSGIEETDRGEGFTPP